VFIFVSIVSSESTRYRATVTCRAIVARGAGLLAIERRLNHHNMVTASLVVFIDDALSALFRESVGARKVLCVLLESLETFDPCRTSDCVENHNVSIVLMVSTLFQSQQ